MGARLKLISHKLCPYVQRAVIALTEKGVAFDRIDIDLANKPDWFLAISPLGKTPVLQVGDTTIFESAVILEYLEETQPKPLHPADPLRRAEHRAWIEFGSAVGGACRSCAMVRRPEFLGGRRGVRPGVSLF
jgi:glutathione S-transferase